MKKSERDMMVEEYLNEAERFEKEARRYEEAAKSMKEGAAQYMAVTDFDSEDENIPVFVYGSLRKTMYNAYMTGCVDHVPAVALGAKLYGKGRVFPYLVLDNSEDTVVGEVLDFSGGQEYRERDIYRMEISAGYSKSKIKVETSEGLVDAYVYDWKHEIPAGFDIVESGDWVEEVKSRRGI
jgi:gamma-glutamylcyclotransferase (GGCT)/AIG2-like uncharacterized protein YtfP